MGRYEAISHQLPQPGKLCQVLPEGKQPPKARRQRKEFGRVAQRFLLRFPFFPDAFIGAPASPLAENLQGDWRGSSALGQDWNRAG
jgi:hypothetical protein